MFFLYARLITLLVFNIEHESSFHQSPSVTGDSSSSIQLDLPLQSPTLLNDLKDLINVNKYEYLLNKLIEQAENDNGGQILNSINFTLNRFANNVDDSDWLNVYFNIIHDLNNRGFPSLAYRLLLDVDASFMSDLIEEYISTICLALMESIQRIF